MAKLSTAPQNSRLELSQGEKGFGTIKVAGEKSKGSFL
jgi:hypothetical protein